MSMSLNERIALARARIEADPDLCAQHLAHYEHALQRARAYMSNVDASGLAPTTEDFKALWARLSPVAP